MQQATFPNRDRHNTKKSGGLNRKEENETH